MPGRKTRVKAAAYGGHFELLKWARENGCGWDAETSSWAAKGGHLEILQCQLEGEKALLEKQEDHRLQ